MPYEEPTIVDEQGNESIEPGVEYIDSPQLAPFRSDQNAFIKHLTERHIPKELGQEHKDQWFHRMMYSGKERSTSFFEDPRSLQLISAMRENLGLIESLDESELKWQHTYDMIDLAVTTHGQHGNMIKALTIKRQEFQDKTQQYDERSLWKKMFSPKQKEPEPGVVRY